MKFTRFEFLAVCQNCAEIFGCDQPEIFWALIEWENWVIFWVAEVATTQSVQKHNVLKVAHFPRSPSLGLRLTF